MSARNAHKSTFIRGSLPNLIPLEDRGFPQCSEPFYVLAHKTENGMYYNDVEAVFQKKVLDTDTIELKVQKNGVDIPNRGVEVFLPNDDKAFAYILEWQKYLQNEGEGCYKVSLECNLAGMEVNYVWGMFELTNWNIDTAMHTVRVYSQFNSFALNHGVDFTGSNMVGSIRFKGFFGKEQPNVRVNNLRGIDNVQTKVTRENLKKYTLTSDLINRCHTKRLIDFHFLHENTVWISDHNPQNHSYDYRDIELIVSEVPEISYQDSVRGAVISAVFEDKKPFYSSKYRSSSPVTDVIPIPTCEPSTANLFDTDSNLLDSKSIPAGQVGDLIAPDTTLQVNGVNEGTHVAGSTIGINVSDGVNPVAPDSVTKVGDNYEMVVPAASTGWVRNPDWLPLPEISTGEQVFYALVAVFPKGNNLVRFRFNVDAGAVNYDFGDGNSTAVSSGIFVSHNYNFNDLSPTTEIVDTEYGVYRQALIEIRPNTGQVFNNLFEFRAYNTRQLFLEIYCNLPNALNVGSITGVPPLLERFRFKEGGTPTGSLLNIFNQCPRLEVIQIDWDIPTNFGSMINTKIKNFGNINAVNATGNVFIGYQTRTFNNQIIGDFDYYGTNNAPLGTLTGIQKIGNVTFHNLTIANSAFAEWHSLEGHLNFVGQNITTATLFIRNCNKLTSLYFDAPQCKNIINFALSCISLNSIVFTDASNIETVDANTFANSTVNLSVLRLPGMKVSFTIQNTNIDAPEMLELFNDLADLIALGLPTATINITNTPASFNLTAVERAIATDKGWAITG